MSSPHAYIIITMVTIDFNVKIRDIEPLVEGHWTTWSHEMKFSFLEAGLTQYIDGSDAPVESDKVSTHAQWKAINLCIIGMLGRHITPAQAGRRHVHCRSLVTAEEEDSTRQHLC